MEAPATLPSEQDNPIPEYPSDIYRTKIPLHELKPETLTYLKGWKRPTFAYVLFEKREIHLGRDMQYRMGTGLFTLTLENRPEQESKLNYYVFKKRFRIIDYGNFPRLNDPNPMRADKARMYSGHKGANPWDAMEQAILGMMGSNPNWREEKARYEEETRGLKAKIAALEAQMKGANNGGQQRGKGNSLPSGS